VQHDQEQVREREFVPAMEIDEGTDWVHFASMNIDDIFSVLMSIF